MASAAAVQQFEIASRQKAFRLVRLSQGENNAAMRRTVSRFFLFLFLFVTIKATSFATTKGLSEIITPDLQPEGDLSLSFQRQDSLIGNPYQLQVETGLTSWAEAAVFKGFEPNELIFGAEFGLLAKEPWLLSTGFANWSPHSHVDPQPYLIGGYYTEHHKFIAGAIHVGYRNEAILGYAYDFNKQWRAQVDFQSGSGNSTAFGFTWNITPNFQTNPAIYVTNDKPHKLLGYVVFTYTFHLWKSAAAKKDATVPGG